MKETSLSRGYGFSFVLACLVGSGRGGGVHVMDIGIWDTGYGNGILT